MTNLIDNVHSKIYEICGHKVILDRDLSKLYQIETRYINKAVKRNINRFPNDFMFQLNKNEFDNLKFQIGTSSWGGTRKMPYVFTQEGIAMLSGILKSDVAVQVNIQIMRAFIETRKLIATHPEYDALKKTIERIESKLELKLQVTDATQPRKLNT